MKITSKQVYIESIMKMAEEQWTFLQTLCEDDFDLDAVKIKLTSEHRSRHHI